MPAPRQLGKDTGLQARMALTLFLLGALYVVLIVALLAAGAGAIFVGLIAGGLLLAQFFASDKLLLTWSASALVDTTCAPGSCCWISLTTRSTSDALSALTSTVLTRAF